jgi:hypothetical protein
MGSGGGVESKDRVRGRRENIPEVGDEQVNVSPKLLSAHKHPRVLVEMSQSTT